MRGKATSRFCELSTKLLSGLSRVVLGLRVFSHIMTALIFSHLASLSKLWVSCSLLNMFWLLVFFAVQEL